MLAAASRRHVGRNWPVPIGRILPNSAAFTGKDWQQHFTPTIPADTTDMIISHRHKFIFMRTTKTASTSMEISLSRFCGPEDVITPVNEVDEPIRLEKGIKPQNYT